MSWYVRRWRRMQFVQSSKQFGSTMAMFKRIRSSPILGCMVTFGRETKALWSRACGTSLPTSRKHNSWFSTTRTHAKIQRLYCFEISPNVVRKSKNSLSQFTVWKILHSALWWKRWTIIMSCILNLITRRSFGWTLSSTSLSRTRNRRVL